MLNLISCIKCFLHLGPRQFFRQYFKLPLIKYIHDTVDLYKNRTKSGVNNLREIILRGIVIALITALLVWLAIFMYIAFYYAYVPIESHSKPVYFKFKSCDRNNDGNNRALCSFPSAYLKLTERQRLLMLGQPYRIHLDLEMPESPINRNLGMFMVCADFRGINGNLLTNSCRSTMLHYRSFLLDTIYKLIFSPFYVFGGTEEKQIIHVEFFSDFEEYEIEPVTDIVIEIQTVHIEIYSAKFFINAHFTGIRFLMYNYPILSAAIGITSNLIFIAIICMISWYQIINSEEYLSYINNQKSQQQQEQQQQSVDDFESGSSSSSIDEEMSLIDNPSLTQRKIHSKQIENIHGTTN